MFVNVSAMKRDQGQTLKGDTHAHIHIHPPMPSTHHMPIIHVHVYPVHLHTRCTCTHSRAAQQRITMQNLTELHQRCQQGVAWSSFHSRRKTFSRTNAVAAFRGVCGLLGWHCRTQGSVLLGCESRTLAISAFPPLTARPGEHCGTPGSPVEPQEPLRAPQGNWNRVLGMLRN